MKDDRMSGAASEIRTQDLLITSQPHYRAMQRRQVVSLRRENLFIMLFLRWPHLVVIGDTFIIREAMGGLIPIPFMVIYYGRR